MELSKAARFGVKVNSDWVMEGMIKGTDRYGVITGFGATSHRRSKEGGRLNLICLILHIAAYIDWLSGHVKRLYPLSASPLSHASPPTPLIFLLISILLYSYLTSFIEEDWILFYEIGRNFKSI